MGFAEGHIFAFALFVWWLGSQTYDAGRMEDFEDNPGEHLPA
jgi:hypothetical protein